jgi:NAD kinase
MTVITFWSVRRLAESTVLAEICPSTFVTVVVTDKKYIHSLQSINEYFYIFKKKVRFLVIGGSVVVTGVVVVDVGGDGVVMKT